MGSWYTYSCDKCGRTYNTSGPWEFYRDKKGQIKQYGHPVPCSKEAEEAGVQGLTANVLCLDCGRESRGLVLCEYQSPVKDEYKFRMWGGMVKLKKGTEEKDPQCPGCGSPKILLSPSPDRRRKVKCPSCKKGHLKGICNMVC
jgi:hypothetical protein